MKNKEPPDKPLLVSVKNTLNNILNHNLKLDADFNRIILDAVERTNKIVFHTYQFIKLFYLHLYETDKDFPDRNIKTGPNLNIQFIRYVMTVLTYKEEQRGSKSNKNKIVNQIQTFYDKYYKPMLQPSDMVCRDKLKRVLNYEEKDIFKNIKTNIKKHFISHLRFFIKIYYGFDKKLDKIDSLKCSLTEKKIMKNNIFGKMNNLVSDIINVDGSKQLSDKKYDADIFYFKTLFIPLKNSYQKKYVPYDVKANPLDYLFQMISIDREIEKINTKIIENHPKDCEKAPPIYRLFNPLPLRTNIVPKYITLDTTNIIDLFVTKGKSIWLQDANILMHLIWSQFFNLEKKSFKRKGYTFHHMIKTDGLVVSILLVKCNANGEPLIEQGKEIIEENDNEDAIKRDDIPYIEDVPIGKLLDYLNNTYYADPGKNSLFEGMLKVDNQKIFFRYTQKQRNHDTKKEKYDKIKEELSKSVINGKTIKEIEAELTNYNSKTGIFKKFLKYAAKKIEINRLLFDHYKQYLYRKLNWNNYMNRCRSEDKMLDKFSKTIGPPSKILVVIGDFDKSTMKGTQSSITKKTYKLFMNRGYQCCKINEHNTSKICSHCHGINQRFLKWTAKNGKEYLLWKLLKCQTCGAIHNRDKNAVKNFDYILENLMKTAKRPLVFQQKEFSAHEVNEKLN